MNTPADTASSTPDSNRETLREYVHRLVDTFPPLTEDQRTHIAELLRPVRYPRRPPARKLSYANDSTHPEPVAAPPRNSDRATQADQ